MSNNGENLTIVLGFIILIIVSIVGIVMNQTQTDKEVFVGDFSEILNKLNNIENLDCWRISTYKQEDGSFNYYFSIKIIKNNRETEYQISVNNFEEILNYIKDF